ncbi:type VI secretion system baseplate subunit TssK [Candidatus Paracaedibacter symbiosus]|uniref:type VI secretion system baseplate subunit TssK n=1 Tax=Candidatus Paracaedibacter symbiosus TaxID=244582 RepID=UPI0005099247|nr:type VI secretion system baseplate subunit TssK [Candidatus Paracaedibacter symbiosus]
MVTQHRIVPAIQWYEGMLLSPQHFQQQELRWHQLQSIQVSHLSAHHWGVINLEFDPVTLPTGLLRVLNLQAIMPDGLVVTHISKPDAAQLQLDLNLSKQKIMDMGATVYVVVPEYTEGFSPVRSEMPRFEAIEGESVTDDNANDNVIQIPRLLPRVSLMVSDAPPARYTSFPIAKVGYVDESFILQPYVPPCFRVPQVSMLGERCGIVVRRLREKSAYLSEKWQAQLGTPLIGETTSQMRPLVQSLPVIEPLLLSDVAHPFQLYQALCQVAGYVSTLRLGQIPPIFPSYNHNDLLTTFQSLFDWVNIVIDSLEKAYSILLFAQRDRLFTIKIQPEIVTPQLLVGLKAPAAMSEGELSDWMRDAIITTESHFESARIRRITGAHREAVTDQELYDLMPGRGVLIFQIDAEAQFITRGERLIIVNPADSMEKRPTEIVFYIKHKDIISRHASSSPEQQKVGSVNSEENY